MTPILLACLLAIAAPNIPQDPKPVVVNEPVGLGIVRVSALPKTFGEQGQWAVSTSTHTLVRGNRVYAPRRSSLSQNPTGSGVGHDLAVAVGTTWATFVRPGLSVGAQLDGAYRLHGAGAVQVGPMAAIAWHVNKSVALYPSLALVYDHVSSGNLSADAAQKQNYKIHQLTLDLSPTLLFHLAEHLSVQVGVRIQQSLVSFVHAHTRDAAGTVDHTGPGALSTTYGLTAGILGWL